MPNALPRIYDFWPGDAIDDSINFYSNRFAQVSPERSAKSTSTNAKRIRV